MTHVESYQVYYSMMMMVMVMVMAMMMLLLMMMMMMMVTMMMMLVMVVHATTMIKLSKLIRKGRNQNHEGSESESCPYVQEGFQTLTQVRNLTKNRNLRRLPITIGVALDQPR